MNCHDCRELILLDAMDQLDGPELRELRAHLQTGCPVCQGRVAEAHAMLALLPASLPAAEVPAGARERLLNRIAQSSPQQRTLRQHKPTTQRDVPTTRAGWFIPAAVGGAIAASVTVLIYSRITADYRKSLDLARIHAEDKQAQIDRLHSAQLDAARQMIRLVKSPGVQLAKLSGLGAQPMAKAELIWDPSRKMILFHAEDLQNLKQGRAYELWLINTKKQAIPAGIFTVDSHGSGMMMSSLSVDPGQLAAGAVSEEQASGVANPTVESILLKGTLE